MRRLILTNKVGKNENSYIVGSGIGKQSRFSRNALKKRASNNSFGECCNLNEIGITFGTLIDGYIKNAEGIVVNMKTNKIIELIKTDNLGNFTIRTSVNVLPNFFKIKFTGGIDIATNLNNVLDLEAIYEKKEIANKLNVTILSTLITRIVENDITDIGTITKLRNIENMIANVFNLSVKQIKEDYILTENIEVTKVINQINVVLKTINSSYLSMPGNIIKESDILNEIGNIIKQNNLFNLLDLTYIDEIVENVVTNNNLLASDKKKENLKKILERGNNLINELHDNLSFEDVFIYSTKINVISSNYVQSSDLEVTHAFDTINAVFNNNINTYPIKTIYNSRSYNINIFECTDFISSMNIIHTLNGNKYTLNNNIAYDANKIYGINNGIYKITNIPESHPLAILNNNKQHLILYTGNPDNKTQGDVNNVLYDFYHGTIDVKVIGDFEKVSFYCLYHGYMGAEDILFYNSTCPSPPPIITLNGGNSIVREVGFPLNDPGATAIDRNDINVKVFITNDLSLSFINNVPIIKTTGVFNLTYSATDDTGSTSQLVRSIEVVDTTDPTITLKPDQYGNIKNITLELGDDFVDPGYDTSDNNSQPLLITVVGLESVNTNVKGTYTVEYSATDVDGYSTTETRTITVEDNIPPEITLIGDNPYIIELGDSYIESSANVFDRSDLTGDSIQLVITNDIQVNSFGNTNKNGSYMVRYEATDINNKQTVKFREIIVRDTTPPNITLLSDPTGVISPIIMELGETYIEYGFYSTDILGISSEYHNSDDINFSVAGTYHVVYTSFDLCNNKSENIRVVVVQDTQKPIITFTGELAITLELGDDFIEPSYTIFDYSPYILTRVIYSIDEDNNIIQQVSGIDTLIKGRYVITYNATDIFSNSTIETISVTVRDSTGPNIQLTGSDVIVIQAGDNYQDEGANASDLGGGNVELTVIGDTFDTSVLGTYNVVYKAIDEDLNETFLTRTVHVIDTTKPVVILKPNNNGLNNFTIQAGDNTYTEYGASVFDNYDTTITLDISYGIATNENGFFNSKQVGTYEITYSATDVCGNTSDIKTRMVTVKDSLSPIITFNTYPGQDDVSHIIIEVGGEYKEYGADVTDNTENVGVSLTSNVDTTKPGEYSVTYIALDDYGNSSFQYRRVSVVDTEAPTILIDGIETLTDFTTIVYLNATYYYPLASAIDNNSKETLFVGDNGKSNVNFNKIGDYKITYSVQDSANNAASIIQTISVRDSSSPVMTLLSDPSNIKSPIIMKVGDPYIEYGATSFNVEYDALPITIVSDVCTNIVGRYSVVYTSVNGEFVSQRTRIVIVEDSTPPIITLLPDPYGVTSPIILELGLVFTDPGVNVSDNYDSPENINISHSYLLNGNSVSDPITIVTDICTNIVGNYTITYTASDLCNNAFSISREVIVVDIVAPTISLSGESIMQIQKNATYTEPGVIVNDNYDDIGDITVIYEGVVLSDVAEYTLSYRAVDRNGNESNTISRRVIVLDDKPPTITFIDGFSTITLEINSDFIPNDGVIARDYRGITISNNDIIISYTLNDVDVDSILTDTANRTYTITYSATDNNNNTTTTKTRDLNIVDTTTPPVVELSGNNPFLLNISDSYNEEGIKASDYSDLLIITGDEVKAEAGSYTLIYSVTDSNQNTTQISRTVIVIEPPTITLTDGSSNIFKSQELYYPKVTAIDASDNELILQGGSDQLSEISNNYLDIQRNNNTLDINTIGSYNISYSVTDAYNLSANIVFTTIVSDPANPTLVLTYATTEFDLNDDTFTYPLVEGVDSYGNTLTLEGTPGQLNQISNDKLTITRQGTLDITSEGTYEISYHIVTILDSINTDLSSTENVTFTVIDPRQPTLVISGEEPLYVLQNSGTNNIVPLPVASAFRANGTVISSDLIVVQNLDNIPFENNSIDSSTIDTYSFNYSVTDPINNKTVTNELILHVRDNLSPTITLNGDSEVTLNQSGFYNELDAEAYDFDNTDISYNLVISNNIDNTTIGSYTVVYSVTNSRNYTTTAERTVMVIQPSETHIINVTIVNSGGSKYMLHGTHSSGEVDGINETININLGDTLDLSMNSPGHPLWIKTQQTTGVGSGVPDLENNGATSGIISWTPGVTGTYYYICQHHSSMVGTIIVS